jgi:hypothetical protein
MNPNIQILLVGIVAFLSVGLAYFSGVIRGQKNPVKIIKPGVYIAWGGHRKYCFEREKEIYFILLRATKDNNSVPIYLDTSNYALSKHNLSGQKVVVTEDYKIRLMEDKDFFNS